MKKIILSLILVSICSPCFAQQYDYYQQQSLDLQRQQQLQQQQMYQNQQNQQYQQQMLSHPGWDGSRNY